LLIPFAPIIKPHIKPIIISVAYILQLPKIKRITLLFDKSIAKYISMEDRTKKGKRDGTIDFLQNSNELKTDEEIYFTFVKNKNIVKIITTVFIKLLIFFVIIANHHT